MSSARKIIADSSGSDTRQHLLDAAERLFADHGLNNVSLRQVNTAAGQKNSGSVHYHFGSREALLKGLLERRMSVLDQERLTFLKSSAIEGALPQDLLRAMSEPLVLRVNVSRDWQSYALIARELLEFRHQAYRPLWLSHYDQGAQKLFGALRHHAPECPDDRWRIAVNETTLVGLGLIADRAQKLIEGSDAPMLEASAFSDHLAWLQSQILLCDLA